MTYQEFAAAVAAFKMGDWQKLTAKPMDVNPTKPPTVASVRLLAEIPVPGEQKYHLISVERVERLAYIDDGRLYQIVRGMAREVADAEFAWRNGKL